MNLRTAPSRSLAASLALLLSLPALALVACSGDAADEADTTASGAGAGPGTGGEGGVGFPTSGSGGTGGSSACVAKNQSAQLKPLDIYVMLDQSGSMVGYYDQAAHNSCTAAAEAGDITPISRWTDVTAALQGFATDPRSEGLNVGLGFFPPRQSQDPGQAKCEDNKCDIGEYADPDVAIAALPGNAASIAEALDFTPCPCNGTPMSAALQGAVEHARERAEAHPDHAVVVVLATDGEPNGACSGAANDDEDYTPTTEVAEAAFQGATSIPVYVIGVGQSLTSLNAIAEAGGTDGAFLVDGNQGTQQALLDALDEIRGKALPCEIQIPPPPDGLTLDPDKVNVEYTPGDGSPSVTFTKVPGPEACASAPNSWYYDDAANPTRIILCDAACQAVQGDGSAQLDVGFGCESEVAIPE